MLEDKVLLLRLKKGSASALQRIYEKYKDDLLALAVSLSNDRSSAEDVLHDVFVSLARYADKLKLRVSLKSYLSTCIANRVRNLHRVKMLQTAYMSRDDAVCTDRNGPDRLAKSAELNRLIDQAMDRISYEQREVIILHLQSGMKFKAIAQSQGVSINTVQSRYRYGLDKLRTLLNGTVEE